ncbi:COG1470 family protein [Amycolatopsis pigmentata]|uniref:Hydrolytic protein n=1 Tax=Amycolatopsis pigmentata TaxID=450801 RepID=A0ABW5FMV3_9PSEU
MTTSAELDLATVVVVPGGEASTTLTVRNDSEIVEAYEFEVAGECAPWTTVEPARLSLYPGTSEAVTLTLRPPRSPRVHAGETPLAVRVVPAERPELAVVPETTVFVAPFGQISAVLSPRRRRAWRTGRYRVLLRNEGNSPVTIGLSTTDPEEELRFAFSRPRTSLEPGVETETRLRMRIHKLIWFGKPVTKPFRLVADPVPEPDFEEEPPRPQEIDGELVQLTVLPRWLLALLALLLALVIAWFALVRPAVQSAAREAAGDQTQDLVRAGQLAPGPSAPGGAGSPNAPGGQAGGQGQGGTGAQQGTVAGSGQQSSGTIEVRTNGGARTVGTYTVPAGKMFLITDLVIANFQGDEGVLTIVFGDRPVTTIALETFRNQDYHWVTPIEIPGNATVAADVTCTKPGTPASGRQAPNCVELLNVSGDLRDIKR